MERVGREYGLSQLTDNCCEIALIQIVSSDSPSAAVQGQQSTIGQLPWGQVRGKVGTAALHWRLCCC